MAASCAFCDIISGQSAAYKIYENEHIYCFLDHDPINEGHVLLVPKQHITTLDACHEDLQTAIMKGIITISRILHRAYAPDGISMMQNGGAFDEIGHIHVHIFPRYSDDGFDWVCDAVVGMSPALQRDRQKLLIQAAHHYFKSTAQDAD